MSGRSLPYDLLLAKTKARLGSLPEPSAIIVKEGDHFELQNQEKGLLPYLFVRNLGFGGSAAVEMVQDINTGSVYARKIFRNVYTRNLEKVKHDFQNELNVMHRLAAHHHIIRVFATYIAQRELALILNPVADDGDLASFLQIYQDAGCSDARHTEKTAILYRAIGCLASGLSFMHKQRVRHKDIKPQNVLIHRGAIIYTDFGISFDFHQNNQSTTTGTPQSYTKKYCAPEVADWGNRNSKSDIFSLGCVYIEMLAAIDSNIFAETFLENPDPYWVKANQIAWPSICNAVDEFSEWILGVIHTMLQSNPKDRPVSYELVNKIKKDHWDFKLFCESCF